MKFSERKGYTEVSKIVQTESVSVELKTDIWNIIYSILWTKDSFIPGYETVSFYDSQLGSNTIGNYSHALWSFYFKKPIDSRPNAAQETFKVIRDYFFKSEWFEFYDLIEFTLNYYKEERLNKIINDTLEKDLSAYRFVNGQITDISR